MSRSAAARAEQAHDRDRPLRAPRPRAAAAPRRVSGPVRAGRPPRARADGRALAMSEALPVPGSLPRPRPRPRRAGGGGSPPLRLAVGGAAVALRVAEAAVEVSGSRTMDRLVRSRAWVVIVAFGLIGIVAMQVSLLKLNSGIGRAVETAATLERTNASLRGEVSRLSSGDRVQALAGTRGFVMPEPADVTFLRARGLAADGSRAARRMHAPDLQIAGPAGSALIPSTVAPSLTEPAAGAAPEQTGAAAPATPAATPATGTIAAPAAPAATAPAPAATAAPQAGAATAAPVTTPPTGGVTTP